MRDAVLFISHEASRTGAPLMLLNFVRWFRERAGIPFAVLAKYDGPLRSEFEALGPFFVFYRRGSWRVRIEGKLARMRGMPLPWMADPDPLRRLRKHGSVGLIYSNTVLNGDVLETMRGWRCPVITHAHELEWNIQNWPMPGCVEPTFALTDRYVAASDAALGNLVRNHGVRRDRVVRVYAPCDVSPDAAETTPSEALERLRDLGVAPHRRIVISCGGITRRKGTDLFVQLAGRVVRQLGPQAPAFVWVGGSRSDAETEAMKRQIADGGLSRDVFLVGQTPYPADYLVLADVFVLPSREESFGIVCLEAGALGKPVVCFASAGVAEVVREDGGIVVPHLDMDAMTSAVVRLLGDPALCGRLGTVLRGRVLRDHTIEVIGPQLMRAMAQCAPEFLELQKWRAS